MSGNIRIHSDREIRSCLCTTQAIRCTRFGGTWESQLRTARLTAGHIFAVGERRFFCRVPIHGFPRSIDVMKSDWINLQISTMYWDSHWDTLRFDSVWIFCIKSSCSGVRSRTLPAASCSNVVDLGTIAAATLQLYWVRTLQNYKEAKRLWKEQRCSFE